MPDGSHSSAPPSPLATAGGVGPDTAGLLGRLDRLPRHAVRWAVTGIVGIALFTIFYCDFAINVSFIQTCTQVVHGCTPVNAARYQRLPVVVYLVTYALGALLGGPCSDRFGRKGLLLAGIGFAVVGSLVGALAGGYAVFVLARLLTGFSFGIVLTVGNTYIGELAPPSGRARYIAISFVLCTVGALFATGFGLLLTTSPGSFPAGLPVALAGPGFASGWRWLYAIGVVAGAAGLIGGARLPESPRWLLEHGRPEEAEGVVARLEERALRRGPLPEPVPAPPATAEREKKTAEAYRELFANPRYRTRALTLATMWFFGYGTVLAFSTSSTAILTGLHFTAPVAGMITAVGGLGFLCQGLFSARSSEKLPRHLWLPIGAVLTLIGCVIIAELGTSITWSFIGSFIVFFGFNVWVPPTFALSAESFPTRIRSAGFGLVDGLGIVGGILGVVVIAPVVSHLSTLAALVIICAFQLIAAVIVQFAPRGRNESLEVVSP